jgi:hypothetical protein
MILPNIIFLDMDGVLCTPRACIAYGNTGGGYSYLDPVACALVKKLCVECNAKIVVSSAWRQMFDQEAMRAILNAACPNLGNYIWQSHHHWRTSDFDFEPGWSDTSDRGREIKRWIDFHETEFNNFVILDDMADMRPLQASLVRCDIYDGMGFTQYFAAEKMLMQGWDLEFAMRSETIN